ncbi:heptaprenylglyceryl phosphate synthase [Paenibacillus tarimensis]|uniref:heptaprenylglyceryl phosphate synthase n=1 Tax=Paenibacillus tarimensis TaxID=416012 RepID=UPI001F32A5FB|nr:heptaprenylglyceryl phosphate synthase [Paenibacillus tarimensis]MCF2944077.1 heptaprenylglyceryl phosphate synthase [Paenibacillus tarimensis]
MNNRQQDKPFAAWRHVFKLDPERLLDDDSLDAICMSGTDAILVGGTTGVTYDNTVDLMARIRRYEVPCALEVSTVEAAVPGFDYYFIPLVLNTGAAEWVTGRQAEAIAQYDAFIPWEMTAAEGYVVLNPDAAVARLTEAKTALSAADAAAYAKLADRLMRLPVVYAEYSGCFGDMELVRAMRLAMSEGRLFYGGGIDGPEKAVLAAQAADTIVVGNVIYSDLGAALATVEAVKKAGFNIS